MISLSFFDAASSTSTCLGAKIWGIEADQISMLFLVSVDRATKRAPPPSLLRVFTFGE